MSWAAAFAPSSLLSSSEQVLAGCVTAPSAPGAHGRSSTGELLGGEGVVDAPLVDVADGDRRAPRLPRHGRGQEADRAGSEHQGRGAWLGPCAVDSMDGDRERLQEGCCVEGHLIREPTGIETFSGVPPRPRGLTRVHSLMTPCSWVVDLLLERPQEMREGTYPAAVGKSHSQIVPIEHHLAAFT